MTLAEGQVYESRYSVRYHVVALWGDFAWVYVMGRFTGAVAKMPKTMHRNFFEQQGMRLLYDLGREDD